MKKEKVLSKHMRRYPNVQEHVNDIQPFYYEKK